MSTIIDSQQLPCGCTLQRTIDDEGQRVLKVEACALGYECRNLINLIGLAGEQGKPTEYRIDAERGQE